jgi:cellulose synthase/poly-beta-1,6-N-acetylglucosamine synthase-like glycosyltransferase
MDITGRTTNVRVLADGYVPKHVRPDNVVPLRPHLGSALVERGLLTPAELDWALDAHRRTGERLGRVLLAAGLVRRQALYTVLAHIWGCGFVDLLQSPPDPAVCGLFDPEQMALEGWIPLDLHAGTLHVATSEPPSDDLRRRIVASCPPAERQDIAGVRFSATTDWDVLAAIRARFAQELRHEAAYGLSERDPARSARGGLSRGQRVALVLTAVGLLAAGALDPARLLVGAVVILQTVFVAGVLFKLAASLAGIGSTRRRERRPAPVRVPDSELPLYTVLVPVYHEANVVGGLIEHLRRLDYPQEKLEILLLMEEDDTETIAAARAAHPPDTVRFILIPDGEPKTKPRACNVGLFFARGEYVVIYDAEDRPEAGQLRDAVAAFRQGADDLVCVQARLNYFNASQNILTRMFTLEYSYWFDYMLPGLDRLALPIPLGGTSNHFRTDRLRSLGGWDAFNVTEDADLGLRATAKGYTVGIITSTTYEEACSQVKPFVRQRTRWIKGYMQTAIVHSRRPVRFTREAGLRGLAGFVLLIAGTPATFLATPILWLLTAVWIVGAVPGTQLSQLFPHPFDTLAELSFVAGNLSMVGLNALAVVRRRMFHLLPFALLAPLYWVLHSIAAWRALEQLIRRPFMWEKTPHGLPGTEPVAHAPAEAVTLPEAA